MIGGLCSILASLILLVLFYSEFIKVFIELNYDKTLSTSYLSYDDGHEPFTYSTDDVILGVQMINFSKNQAEFNITSYVQPFTQILVKTTYENGTFSYNTEKF